jgi:hypothetical protein
LSVAKILITEAAKELSQRKGKCQDCNETCSGNCKGCLEKIHMEQEKRRYNCHFMRSYYIVSYLYKYKKEIRMALEVNSAEILRHLNLDGPVKIVSIGCGPGTEIVGFQEFLLDKVQNPSVKLPDINIKYVGIDINGDWKDYFSRTNDLVESKFKNSGVPYKWHFYKANVFDFNLNNETIDIVFLPYVLSEIKKYCDDEKSMNTKVGNLWKQVENKLYDKSIIVCNDINHVDLARSYFDTLYQQITLPKKICKSCFHQNKKYYHYGNIIDDHGIDNDYPDDVWRKYNVWSDCTSAQAVIFVG